MWYMGKRTSIYLTDQLAARVAASRLPLGALITLGLDYLDMEQDAPDARGPESHAEPTGAPPTGSPAPKPARQACAHRRAVKGWCGECRTGGHL
jgi:hypothetical protein